jgi:hypothetical protein
MISTLFDKTSYFAQNVAHVHMYHLNVENEPYLSLELSQDNMKISKQWTAPTLQALHEEAEKWLRTQIILGKAEERCGKHSCESNASLDTEENKARSETNSCESNASLDTEENKASSETNSCESNENDSCESNTSSNANTKSEENKASSDNGTNSHSVSKRSIFTDESWLLQNLDYLESFSVLHSGDIYVMSLSLQSSDVEVRKSFTGSNYGFLQQEAQTWLKTQIGMRYQ